RDDHGVTHGSPDTLLAVAHVPPGFVFSILRRPPGPTLFPYTTLFRSARCAQRPAVQVAAHRHRRVRAGGAGGGGPVDALGRARRDRKSTRLNSSHVKISYAVFCLKKKQTTTNTTPTNAQPMHHERPGA